MDGISGTVINEVFRQIKVGKVTNNTSEKFCWAAVPSITLLFQWTIDILEEKNDIAFSPPIHNDWQKDVIRMVHQHLIFLNCPTRKLLDLHERSRLTRDSAVERKEVFCYDEGLLCLMFKKICEGNRGRGLATIPYLLTVCKFA